MGNALVLHPLQRRVSQHLGLFAELLCHLLATALHGLGEVTDGRVEAMNGFVDIHHNGTATMIVPVLIVVIIVLGRCAGFAQCSAQVFGATQDAFAGTAKRPILGCVLEHALDVLGQRGAAVEGVEPFLGYRGAAGAFGRGGGLARALPLGAVGVDQFAHSEDQLPRMEIALPFVA